MTIQEVKELFLYNWSFVRIIRLGMGGIALYQAIDMKDYFIGILAVLLLAQGIMNWSCCGAGACAPKTTSKKSSDLAEEVEYEEVN